MLTFKKDWKQYPPIPESGVREALELMQSGPLHRYHGTTPTLAEFEQEFSAYVGKDFVLGLNSCGSALFIALKALGVEAGDKVLSNSLTFNAVPSSIVHAGAQPIYVECNADLVVDLDDLKEKSEISGAKYFILSHMRGKIADLDLLYDYCDRAGIAVIEDCAHALGARWDNTHVGAKAAISCFSFQSHKVINAGEGGMLATSDPDLAARSFIYSGCFEKLYLKHTARPPIQYFEKYRNQLPNYSLRMTNLSAALLRPQFRVLEERIATFNHRFNQVSAVIGQLPGIKVVYCHPKARSMNDCVQFHLSTFTSEQALSFLHQCREHGILIAIFGEVTNARNFQTWQFSEVPELPKTESIIPLVCDMSLPALFEDSDWDMILSIFSEIYLAHYKSSQISTHKVLSQKI